MEQLLLKGSVPSQGTPLLQITKATLPEVVSSLAVPERTYLMVEGGQATTLSNLEQIFAEAADATIGIGAFPHGDFSKEITSLFVQKMELDKDVMMAWHICAAVVWSYSKSVEIIRKRYAS
jgi:rRNA pseudouridine-1189 N-methylase Emg1 (Nep1/Mra1 family)